MKNQTSKISNGRWAAYAAAGAAAAIAGAETAEAQITHVVVGSPDGDIDGGDDQYFTLVGTTALNFFNLDGGGGTFGAAYFGVYNGTFQGEVAGFVGNSFFNYASNLASGVNISTANFLPSTFATLAFGSGYTNSQFVDTSGFVAFRFNGGTQFGWARLTFDADASPLNAFTLEEYAFAEAGTSIAVGQISAIPEPGSLGLLALGGIGLLASRRRKSA